MQSEKDATLLVLNREGGHEPGMQAVPFSSEVGKGKKGDSP